jgi:hypothetical protein
MFKNDNLRNDGTTISISFVSAHTTENYTGWICKVLRQLYILSNVCLFVWIKMYVIMPVLLYESKTRSITLGYGYCLLEQCARENI